MPQEPALTAAEQKLDDVWTEHLRAEFSAHSPDETIVTMQRTPSSGAGYDRGQWQRRGVRVLYEILPAPDPAGCRDGTGVPDDRPREAGI